MELKKYFINFLLLFLSLNFYASDKIKDLDNFYIKNIGQLKEDVIFYSDNDYGRVYIKKNGISLDLFFYDSSLKEKFEKIEVSLSFEGANFSKILPEKVEITKINIFKGKDKNMWFKNIPTFKSLRILNIYEGVDLVLQEDFWKIEADKNEKVKKLNFKVIAKERVDYFENYLVLRTKFGNLRLNYPKTKEKTEIISFKKAENQEFFWGTFIGGWRYDYLSSMQEDSEGNIIITGATNSADIPTPSGFDNSINNASYYHNDIYLAKISSKGDSLLWATYIGGEREDFANAIVLDNEGSPVIIGHTSSKDLPFANNLSQTFSSADNYDIYIAKISSQGNEFIWGTLLGGIYNDFGLDLKIDSNEDIIILGETYSPDIPAINGFDEIFNSSNIYYSDIYLAKISKDGNNLLWGTFIGGIGSDGARSISMDNLGNIYVCGFTKSNNMPVKNALDYSFNGDEDIYLGKFSSDGKSILWGTYIGGEAYDTCNFVTIGKDSSLFLTGNTSSKNIPVINGYDKVQNGNSDIYVAKISAEGNSFLWATYIGGTMNDYSYSIALDFDDNIFIAGNTYSPDIPVPNGYSSSIGEDFFYSSDIYLAKLSSQKGYLLWGTYFGGESADSAKSVLYNLEGNLIVGGSTSSKNIKTKGFDETYNEGGDIYVFSLSDIQIEEGPPIPSFIWEPNIPRKREEVKFIDLSLGNPTEWLWDFGDDTTSADQNPRHIYSIEGNYFITLKVSNEIGSQTLTKALTIIGEDFRNYIKWIPSVVKAKGDFGSKWKTEVSILNKEKTENIFDLYFYSNLGVLKKSYVLGPLQSHIFEDILDFFEIDGIGFLEIRANGNFEATSLIYPENSTLISGQIISSYSSSEALNYADEGYIIHLKQNEEFRTNLLFTNTCNCSGVLEISLYDSSGNLLSNYDLKINPKEFKGLLSPFKTLAGKNNVIGGFAKIKVLKGYGIIALGSVINNKNNNGVIIPIKK